MKVRRSSSSNIICVAMSENFLFNVLSLSLSLSLQNKRDLIVFGYSSKQAQFVFNANLPLSCTKLSSKYQNFLYVFLHFLLLYAKFLNTNFRFFSFYFDWNGSLTFFLSFRSSPTGSSNTIVKWPMLVFRFFFFFLSFLTSFIFFICI